MRSIAPREALIHVIPYHALGAATGGKRRQLIAGLWQCAGSSELASSRHRTRSRLMLVVVRLRVVKAVEIAALDPAGCSAVEIVHRPCAVSVPARLDSYPRAPGLGVRSDVDQRLTSGVISRGLAQKSLESEQRKARFA